MPSLSAKDRVSLCLFSYEDGRRCRTPRISTHPHFCFYHAQKESQSQATESLAKDLDYFFSGEYLSASDLSAALSRLIPAVIRGHIKPRLARTVAYMFQTQLQAIHLSQREYANAFGTEGWRKAVRNSITSNYDHVSPPDPADAPEPAPQPPAQTPAPSPAQAAPPSPSRPAPRASVGAGLARPDRTNQPGIPVPPTTSVAPSQTAQPTHPTPTPSEPPTQPRQPGGPTRDPYAVHFDHNYRLIVDGKPW